MSNMLVTGDAVIGGSQCVATPCGKLCVDCITGCKQALPYLHVDDIIDRLEHDLSFQAFCHQFTDIGGGRQPPVLDANESVCTDEAQSAVLEALYDGHTRESFMKAHRGVPPEEVGVEGYTKPHPHTEQPRKRLLDNGGTRWPQGQPASQTERFCQKLN